MSGQPGSVQGGNVGNVGSAQQQAAAAAAAAAGKFLCFLEYNNNIHLLIIKRQPGNRILRRLAN